MADLWFGSLLPVLDKSPSLYSLYSCLCHLLASCVQVIVNGGSHSAAGGRWFGSKRVQWGSIYAGKTNL